MGLIMTPNEYQVLAYRTFLGKDMTKAERCMYQCLKIQEESFEVVSAMSELELREEIGDLLWHIAGLCTDLGIHFESVFDHKNDSGVYGRRSSVELGAHIAKHFVQGKSFDERLVFNCLRSLISFVQYSLPCSLEDCMKENIAKLEARHAPRPA